MQSGELIVTGNNTIEISLHQFPSAVNVEFEVTCPEPVPCDPGSVDYLEYETFTLTDGSVVLAISWAVSSVREIKWNASY